MTIKVIIIIIMIRKQFLVVSRASNDEEIIFVFSCVRVSVWKPPPPCPGRTHTRNKGRKEKREDWKGQLTAASLRA